MAMLCDDAERHDVHTAHTFAHSIARGFDAKLSRAPSSLNSALL